MSAECQSCKSVVEQCYCNACAWKMFDEFAQRLERLTKELEKARSELVRVRLAGWPGGETP